jgi:hypothetical protein
MAMRNRIRPGGPFLQPHPPFSQLLFAHIADALTAGFNSAQSEATGWNATVRDALKITWERTSDTVATGTIQAVPTYDITAQETITVTVPAVALQGAAALVATPTFTVSATQPARRQLPRNVSQAVNRSYTY